MISINGNRFNENSPIIPINLDMLYPEEMLLDVTDAIIPGIFDYYMISNYGRIYHKYMGDFLKPGLSGSKYFFVYLSTLEGPKMVQVHRLVMLAFCPIPNAEEMQVNHKNGNKLDNRLCNLEWCTRSENILHAFKTGLHSRPSNLDPNLIKTVCDLLAEGKYTDEEISNMVGNGVTKTIVQDVKAKTSWKDISENYVFDRRVGKIFSEEMANNICKYFENNNIGNLTVNDHCRNALKYYGYDESLVDSARKIYTRKHYKNISCHYVF